MLLPKTLASKNLNSVRTVQNQSFTIPACLHQNWKSDRNLRGYIMTFKWGKLYHRSLQFFLSSGLGGCDENRNDDALIDGCCLSIYSDLRRKKKKIFNPLFLGELLS